MHGEKLIEERKVRQRHVPFGYRIQNGLAVIVQEEAEILQSVFEDYLSGVSTYQLAKRLSARQVPNCNGKPSWHHGSVGRLLENERYCGDEFYPSMISRERFNLVQQRRKEQMEQLGRVEHPNENGKRGILHGMLVCGDCGREYRKYAKKHRKMGEDRWHWRCSSCTRHGNPSCGNIALEEEQIRKAVMSALRCAEKTMKSRKTCLQNMIKGEPIECRRLTERLEELFEAGHFSAEEIKALLYRRAEKLYQVSEIPVRQYRTERMKNYLKQHKVSGEFDEEALRYMIERVVVQRNGKLDVHLMDGKVIQVAVSPEEGRKRIGESSQKEHIHHSGKTGV